MIIEGQGNMLVADVEALVNTVNTVGVMGKGIALQFKRAFPDNYRDYRAACERGEVRLGKMFVVDRGVMGRHRYLVNFPTKGHWRTASRIADIETGLADLIDVVQRLGITSMAIPALGCGNGGLNWEDVRPRIEDAFAGLPDVRVIVFPPHGAPDPAGMPVATTRPDMTLARAGLLTAMAQYTRMARLLEPREGISELEIQKLTYLLQILGMPSRLTFVTGRYGPYAEELHYVLQGFEGHQIIGYGDRSARVSDLQPILLTDGVEAEAWSFLAEDPSSKARLDRLTELVEGFETPYGMELLATVHFVAHESPPTRSPVALNERVADWSSRKAKLFTPFHVGAATKRLLRFDLLPEEHLSR
ncbi:MAG TPA: macro domain-containing protein [Kineosporiaceae bacterium]|nr:macro domain-containing protein [Kineosporiaceae bacterium]